MKLNFKHLQLAVLTQFNSMAANNQELFETDINGDDLYQAYLDSFPTGTNPLYRERTEHDCNCCKNFIRRIGNVVTVEDGELKSIWGGTSEDPNYQVVMDKLNDLVTNANLTNVFRNDSKKVGNKTTVDMNPETSTTSWDHFYVDLPSKYVLSNGQSYGEFKGGSTTNKEVLERSVKEISKEAIDIVIDLIDQGSLYRGEEHLQTVNRLQNFKREYDTCPDEQKDSMLWLKSTQLKESGRFRNTVIGTLLTDISNGVELDKAVKSFETKVAPANYKRSSALITQGMIKKAEQTVVDLGIEQSLQRRFAKTDDLTVNNVLFADRSAKEEMGVLGLAPTKTSKSPDSSKVEEISIEDFIQKVLPKADKIEVMPSNNHLNSFMSVIAPVVPDAPNILKWGNNFSWSYDGDVTDSIKQRVKSAGGNVTGEVRCSLSWFNTDDLDLHMVEPKNNHIYFGNRRSIKTGGNLDVDMNNGNLTTTPVENICYPKINKMVDGDYKLYVNQFAKRNSDNVGFEVEIEILGEVHSFSYDKLVKGNIDVATLKVKNGKVTVVPILDSSTTSKEKWGVDTNQWNKVSMVMNSPNHWDGEETGNKHYFFILDGCVNPERTRGFYNEFLRNELTEHRKVFEVLGGKMKTEESDEQLSGLGFSSTQRNDIPCRVSGSFNRTLKIKF